MEQYQRLSRLSRAAAAARDGTPPQKAAATAAAMAGCDAPGGAPHRLKLNCCCCVNSRAWHLSLPRYCGTGCNPKRQAVKSPSPVCFKRRRK